MAIGFPDGLDMKCELKRIRKITRRLLAWTTDGDGDSCRFVFGNLSFIKWEKGDLGRGKLEYSPWSFDFWGEVFKASLCDCLSVSPNTCEFIIYIFCRYFVVCIGAHE